MPALNKSLCRTSSWPGARGRCRATPHSERDVFPRWHATRVFRKKPAPAERCPIPFPHRGATPPLSFWEQKQDDLPDTTPATRNGIDRGKGQGPGAGGRTNTSDQSHPEPCPYFQPPWRLPSEFACATDRKHSTPGHSHRYLWRLA